MKKWQLLSAMGMLTVTLAACGNDDNADDSSNSGENTAVESPDKTDNSSTVSDKRPVSEVALALDEALMTFDDTYKGAKISSIELDESNHKFTYDIDGFDDKKEYNVEIDDDNKVIEQQQENRDNDDDYNELMLDDYLSVNEAIDKASEASEVGDLEATSWSLEYDDDDKTAVYNVKFENTKHEVEVTLDATTGAQLQVEKD